MKKVVWFSLIVLLVASCAPYQVTTIAQPPLAGKVSVVPQSPDSAVWRPDPTRVIFRNYSLATHIDIWLDRRYEGDPDLQLQPEQAAPANFAGIGLRTIYLRGREITPRGWRDLGVKKKELWISHGHSYGGPGEIQAGNWDFE